MRTLRLLWFVPSPLAILAENWKLSEGLTLQAERNASSDMQFDALASGAADAVVTAMDNVMDWNLRMGPQDLRVVAQLESTTPLSIISRPGLNHLDDLRGATVLVDGPSNGFIVALRAMLAEAGLGQHAYSLAPVGGVKERFDAMVSGRGDATLLGPPFDAMAIEAGMSRLASIQDRYPSFPGQGLVVSGRTIEQLRPVLTAWIGALDEARIRMVRDPGTARQVLTHFGFPAPAVEVMIRTTAASLQPDPAGVALLIEQRRSAGLPGAETTYERLVDISLLPQA
ncbi:ABC transporter substrate-binding protein [Hydrogenophaga sp.]|uniref:ABC transporter substrate-binding protein n=1 Tax=Hydrogenophaga sp. TaxID=1904254 RepID=UPI0027169334|nr:ABC transporter substrate-binding protein [Hydrogenophaga sp.]MDO8905614.1 ABC transporter substrate-binding protein [Hydrogenophaga sp.]